MNHSPRKIFESQYYLGKLIPLTQLMVYIYFWLLFFNNDNFKYTAISQRKTFTFFSLFYNFFLFYRFLIISLKTFMDKKTSRLQSILCIIHFEYLLHNVSHSVENIDWRMFLRGLFLLLFPSVASRHKPLWTPKKMSLKMIKRGFFCIDI